MRGLVVVPFLLTAACDNMVDQRRYDPYEASRLFGDGKVMQVPPNGTVSRDEAKWRAEAQRPPMSGALLARGKDRYHIYCTMCHGLDGSGDGTVTARGFPRPAAFQEPTQRALTPEQSFAAISQGYGTMYGFADRVPAQDRWAMVAYVRALGRIERR